MTQEQREENLEIIARFVAKVRGVFAAATWLRERKVPVEVAVRWLTH